MTVSVQEFDLMVAFVQALAPVPRELMEELRDDLGGLNLDKREHFVRAGEPTADLGFVVQGLLRVYYSRPDGTEHVRIFPTEGEPASAYGALLTGRVADVSIQAVEPTRLVTLPHQRLVEQYPRHPAWQEFGRKAAERYMLIREAREYELLMYTAKERYDRFVAAEPELHERLPQYEIASYLGITPESLSRLRARRGR